MLDRVDGHELQEWKAFFLEEPFGQNYLHVQIAELGALLANVNRNPRKQPKAYTRDDFLIRLKPRKEPELTPEEKEQQEKNRAANVKTQIAMIASLWGTEVIKEDGL